MAESDVQRRVAEMDERLASIQAELETDAGVPQATAPPLASDPPAPASKSPPPPAPEPPPPPAPAPPPAAPASAAAPPLEAMTARLLAAMRELMAGYEIALAHISAAPGAGSAVTVAAGPFTGIEMLERFEQALRTLPQVSDVSVRGYEGADRAIVEVQLRG
jgi:hypothetical protein